MTFLPTTRRHGIRVVIGTGFNTVLKVFRDVFFKKHKHRETVCHFKSMVYGIPIYHILTASYVPDKGDGTNGEEVSIGDQVPNTITNLQLKKIK